jgi:hypothetical protein
MKTLTCAANYGDVRVYMGDSGVERLGGGRRTHWSGRRETVGRRKSFGDRSHTQSAGWPSPVEPVTVQGEKISFVSEIRRIELSNVYHLLTSHVVGDASASLQIRIQLYIGPISRLKSEQSKDSFLIPASALISLVCESFAEWWPLIKWTGPPRKGVQFQWSATPRQMPIFARCQLSKCESADTWPLRGPFWRIKWMESQGSTLHRPKQTLDNCKIAGWWRDVSYFIKCRNRAADDDVPRIYEPRSERMRRRFSLIVINILGFISCLGFSIVLTSAFPYLIKVWCHYPPTNPFNEISVTIQMDPSADKKFLGWVIAANPLGQLISSPLVGYVANRWKSVRLLCILTGILNVIGFALYASVGALPQPRKYWIIMARFIVGFAAGANSSTWIPWIIFCNVNLIFTGSVTLCIMYISKATTLAERTTFISMNAFVQTVGFILGPGLIQYFLKK